MSTLGTNNVSVPGRLRMPPGFLMWVISRQAPEFQTVPQAVPGKVLGEGNVVIYQGPKPPTVAGVNNVVVTSEKLTQAQFDRLMVKYMRGELGKNNLVLGTDGMSEEEIELALD